jgi:hypothetical protein
MEEFGRTVMAFTGRADERLTPNLVGASDPFSAVVGHVTERVTGSNEADDEAVEQFRRDPGALRFREWDQIH